MIYSNEVNHHLEQVIKFKFTDFYCPIEVKKTIT